LKLLQERIGNTVEHIGIGKIFLNRIPIAQQLRERIDKWNYMKKLLQSKGNSNQTEEEAQRMGENLCQLFT
jgi:hypothetical protein